MPTRKQWETMSTKEKECWRYTNEELKQMCRKKGISGYSRNVLSRQHKGWGFNYKNELVALCCMETKKPSFNRKTSVPEPIKDLPNKEKLKKNKALLEELFTNDEFMEIIENDLLMERGKGVWGYRFFCKGKDEPIKIQRYAESDGSGRVERGWFGCKDRRDKAGIVFYSDDDDEKEISKEMMHPGLFSLVMMRSGDRPFGCRAFDKNNPKIFCLVDGTPSTASKKRVHQKLRRIYRTPDSTREQYEEAFKPVYEIRHLNL